MLSARPGANLMQSHAAWVVPLVLVVGMLYVQQWPAALDVLDYAPERLSSDPWRWWSAHFVHLNATHLVANLLAFTAVCLIFAPWLRGFVLLGVVLVSATCASLVPWLANQDLHFAGFSGVLHGLLLFACVRVAQQHWLGFAMLALLTAKLLAELCLGYFSDSQLVIAWLGSPTAYLAHLGGALGGGLSLLALLAGNRKR
ncbi:rhombosortase [Aliidiomarina soli]|uniref:Rhombosortase n=1 Tax=Aliidiomarina soli TaxID=1928574 RepID=A0A432WLT4_9GAMM|nr:rhombosortase [Aliidiomarina soli]RUO34776.1 rhombosortase [Aliidiomarina soli]